MEEVMTGADVRKERTSGTSTLRGDRLRYSCLPNLSSSHDRHLISLMSPQKTTVPSHEPISFRHASGTCQEDALLSDMDLELIVLHCATFFTNRLSLA